MTDWRTSIEKTLKTQMPYAFSVNGVKGILQEDNFKDAFGYLKEEIWLLMKRAFKAGHKARNGEVETYPVEVEDFMADRAFERWENGNV